MGRRRHVWGSAVGGLALVLAVAGCGGESASGDGPFGDGGAPEKVTGDQAPAVAKGAAAAVFASVDKVHAKESVAATMTVTFPGGRKVGYEAAIKFGDPGGMRMTMDLGDFMPGGVPGGGDGTIDALVTPTAMYMNMGTAIGGRSWIRMDYADLEAADPTGSAEGLGELMGSGLRQQDPTQQLSLLKGTTDITEVGTETIDGVRADHYAATLDQAQIDALSAAKLDVSEEMLGRLREANRKLGVTRTSIDVWVDPKTGLPIRQSVRSKTGTLDSEVTIDYRDWGLTVDITPPSDAETTDFADVMNAPGDDTSL